MKNLYKKIIETLTNNVTKQNFIDAGLSPVKLVDEYEGQYFQPEMFEGLILPAVLVEWDINYPKPNEPGTATVNIHIMYEQTEHADSHSKQIDRALKRFDFYQKVYELLNGIESENTGKLQLQTESGLKEPAITKVYIYGFTCSYTGKLNRTDWGETTPEDMELSGHIKAFDVNLDI